jgi:3-hydroxyacyl-[acyl-carrier-protein] dehydratase
MTQVDATMPDAQQPSRGVEPLFDVTGLDTSGLALSRRDLEAWNPHRGDIVQLDGVVWKNESLSRAVGIKHVRHDEFWVSGHFPQRPVMPGVLMVEAGAQLASYLFYARRGEPCIAGFTRIEDTVFRNPVTPGQDLLILCEEIRYRPRRFISEIQGLVDGRVAFYSKITGMVLPEE